MSWFMVFFHLKNFWQEWGQFKEFVEWVEVEDKSSPSSLNQRMVSAFSISK